MSTIRRLLLSLLLVCCTASAQAQNYPNRPIRLIVSIAAGSVTDVIMRKTAAELAAERPPPSALLIVTPARLFGLMHARQGATGGTGVRREAH